MGNSDPTFMISEQVLARFSTRRAEFLEAAPFPHVVLDDFLPPAQAAALEAHFPDSNHPIWLDWRKRSAHQYGKQGPGNSARFDSLPPLMYHALHEFNSWKFLLFLQALTGVEQLLPDPYFRGGGLHQILRGGILDIHTDFNYYRELNIYRRLNVLLYLNSDWRAEYNGELELWDGGRDVGRCVKSIAPIFNRAVIFKTDKKSFHGHPSEWMAPEPVTRKSIALYYYTAAPEPDAHYDEKTDFQGVAYKELPREEPHA